ncbi:MAG TPA: PaaI family thioesterase [Gemmatimonadaceae bacterium]|nr:PaaI family thioesterase [Gemmatimonadaceae bacterium]
MPAIPDVSPAVQDFYPDSFSHCYGCGRLNAHGLHLKSRWDGDETVARYTPRPHEIAVPGFVYGGLLASLLDCHAMATAAAARERSEGRVIGDAPALRYVTAMLKVDFLRPTPVGPALEVRGRVAELSERKVVVDTWIVAEGAVTARASVVAVPMPAAMKVDGGRT